jgi:hypothetical protein
MTDVDVPFDTSGLNEPTTGVHSFGGGSAFHQGTTLATRLIAALKLEPFTRMMLNDWNPWGQASWFTLLFIILIVLGWSRLRASWILFAMAVLLLPYLTLSGGPAGFVSMSRFNLVSFPLFVTLAGLGLRAKWLLAGVIGLFGASLFKRAIGRPKYPRR